MQEVLNLNSPVVTGICNPCKFIIKRGTIKVKGLAQNSGIFLSGNYFLKVSSVFKNARPTSEFYSKLIIKTPERRYRRRSWCLYC